MAPPTPPSALIITATEVGKLFLTWTAPSPALEVPAEYWIYSGTSLASLTGTTVEAMIGTDVVEYTSADLGTGVTRYYDVYTATDIGVTNELSTTGAGPESGITWDVPGAPTGLSIEPGDGQVYVTTWIAPVDNGGSIVTDYYLYRGTSALVVVKVHEMGSAVVAPYLDSGLTNGVTYYYKMSAVNELGEGAKGAEVHGLVTAAPVTLTNQYLYNAESLREFVFDLSGASSYVLPVATNFLVLSLHASFASTTNVTAAHRIIVDKTAKTVKVLDAAGESPLEFNLSVIAVCRDKLFQNDS
jgi:hypothetical protein